MRLDRLGDKVAAYVSSDGVKWLYLDRKIAKFPAKVQVGVAVVNTAKEPVTVRFSEFGTAVRSAEASKRAAVKPLTKEQQDKLLAARSHGGMAHAFSRCAKLFLISSRMELPYGVAVMTSSQTIAKAELQPVFPRFYRPTLREYLDAIALQASSEWKYDPTSKFFRSEVDNGPAEDLAIFEFTESKRAKPFQVVLPKGWKAIDKGNGVTYVPPIFPLGIDIHELGSYSSDDGTEGKDLLKKVVAEVSSERAKRVKGDVELADLKPAKVGPYEALYFETTVPLRNGATIRWRQWVFSAGNKCYFAVSTIFPQFEERIFPDVQAILKSFQIGKAETGRTDE